MLAFIFLPAVAWAVDNCQMMNCKSPTSDIDNLKKFWESTNGADWQIRDPAIGRAWDFTKDSSGNYLNQPCQRNSSQDPSGNPFLRPWVGIACTCTSTTTCQINTLILTTAASDGNIKSLTGTLPSELTQLTSLTQMNFQYGQLTGTLPSGLLAMPLVSIIQMQGNLFNGSIPSTPCTGTSGLIDLNLSGNRLTGNIPDALSTFTNLLVLSLSSNGLTGTIPDVLSSLSAAQALDLSGNALKGQIPAGICSLGRSNQSPISLSLAGNQLTGSIPAECATNSAISTLDFSQNFLDSTIPSALGRETTLRTVILSYNRLTGAIPASLMRVQSVYLSSNLLSGELPSPPCSNETFNMYLDGNKFSGAIPSFAACTKLSIFQLDGMMLTGNLPNHILPLTLTVLNVTNTRISGPIPEKYLSGPGNLIRLVLTSNDLSGTLSPSLGNLSLLTYLDLSKNNFVGSIPAALARAGGISSPSSPCESFGMSVLDLSHNDLTGTVPTELSNWAWMSQMLLNNNRLENAGSFDFLTRSPLCVDSAGALSILDVSNNRFTGTLPDFIFQGGLEVFGASQNCFHGAIPVSICSATALKVLALTALNSGEDCRSPISFFGWEFSGFRAEETMVGTVPECLYSLPSINALLLTFLNLEGVVPEKISSSMETFALQGNRYTGSLSRALVTSPNLKSLVLSHNYISGSLEGFGAGRNYDLYPMNLLLDVNAISGIIPTSLFNFPDISILYGNVFTCEDGAESLPQHDKSATSYECGSSSVDQVVYVLGALTAIAFVTHLLLRNRLRFNKYTHEISLWIQVVDQRTEIDASIHAAHLIAYQSYLYGVVLFAIKISAYIFALGFTYIFLARQNYRTVEHVYSWAVSSAYLYGDVPSITCLTGWTGMMLFVCIFTVQESSRVKRENKHRTHRNVLLKSLNPDPSAEKHVIRTWSMTFICILRLSIFFTFIVGVVVAMNALYLYVDRVATSSVQTLFKLGFAGFKLTWTNVVTQRIYHASFLHFGVQEKVHNEFIFDMFHGKASVLLLASFMVQFLVPFAVTIFLSPACLKLAFDPDPPIKYSYSYIRSNFPGGSTQVIVHEETSAPFVYSTNCFDTILDIYVPLYGAMFMVSLVKSLLQFIYLLWSIAHKNDPTAEDTVWYRGILKVINYTLPMKNLYHNSRYRKKSFQPGKIWPSVDKVWVLQTLVHQMDRMLLLVTYGALCPPLGFLIVASMISDAYIEKLLMGRFMTREVTAIHAYWNREKIRFAQENPNSDLRESSESFAQSFGIRGSSVFSSIGSTNGIHDDETRSSGSITRSSSIHDSAREIQRLSSTSSISSSSSSIQRIGSQGSIDNVTKLTEPNVAPRSEVREGTVCAIGDAAEASTILGRHTSASNSQEQYGVIESDVQDAAEPWGALAALTEVDRQCGLLPATLLKLSCGSFVNAQALLFCFALYDIQNGGGRFLDVPWASITMFSIFLLLRLWMWTYHVFFKAKSEEWEEHAEVEGNKDAERGVEVELGCLDFTRNPMLDEVNSNERRSQSVPARSQTARGAAHAATRCVSK